MTEYLLTLSSDFTTLLEKTDDYNVLIEIGQKEKAKTFRAHSIILRARSEYFRAALSNDWVRREGDIMIFKKPNISCNVFDVILRFIYSGTIYLELLEDSEIFELLEASDEDDLGVEETVSSCEVPKNIVIQAPRISQSNIDSEIILSKHAILISNYIVKKNIHSSKFALPLTSTSSHSFKNEKDITNTSLAQLQQQQSSEIISKISRVRPYFIDGAIFDTQHHGPCFGYGDIWF
ncbi:12875_t:CDS:2, partial [Funneliformis mosseae]